MDEEQLGRFRQALLKALTEKDRVRLNDDTKRLRYAIPCARTAMIAMRHLEQQGVHLRSPRA